MVRQAGDIWTETWMTKNSQPWKDLEAGCCRQRKEHTVSTYDRDHHGMWHKQHKVMVAGRQGRGISDRKAITEVCWGWELSKAWEVMHQIFCFILNTQRYNWKVFLCFCVCVFFLSKLASNVGLKLLTVRSRVSRYTDRSSQAPNWKVLSSTGKWSDFCLKITLTSVWRMDYRMDCEDENQNRNRETSYVTVTRMWCKRW